LFWAATPPPPPETNMTTMTDSVTAFNLLPDDVVLHILSIVGNDYLIRTVCRLWMRIWQLLRWRSTDPLCFNLQTIHQFRLNHCHPFKEVRLYYPFGDWVNHTDDGVFDTRADACTVPRGCPVRVSYRYRVLATGETMAIIAPTADNTFLATVHNMASDAPLVGVEAILAGSSFAFVPGTDNFVCADHTVPVRLSLWERTSPTEYTKLWVRPVVGRAFLHVAAQLKTYMTVDSETLEIVVYDFKTGSTLRRIAPSDHSAGVKSVSSTADGGYVILMDTRAVRVWVTQSAVTHDVREFAPVADRCIRPSENGPTSYKPRLVGETVVVERVHHELSGPGEGFYYLYAVF
jgi:hypothetical protein